MFDAIDQAYYAKRAAQEREQAEQAINHYIAKIHLRLAEEYERKAHALGSSGRRLETADG